MPESSLVGTWRLVSFEFREEDGTVAYPAGQDAYGYLIYHPDGYMSAAAMAADRPQVAPYVGLSTVEEKAAAFDTYLNYCGRYEVGEDQVFHHIELSLLPNLIGSEDARYFELEGDRLTIHSDPILQLGKVRASYVIWRRA